MSVYRYRSVEYINDNYCVIVCSLGVEYKKGTGLIQMGPSRECRNCRAVAGSLQVDAL